MHDRIEWNEVEFFCAIARAGTSLDAARLLKVSQPTVSRFMRHFEKKIGKTLFRRHSRGIVLTPFGEQILESAQLMERHMHHITEMLDADSVVSCRSVQVSVTSSLMRSVVYPMLEDFYRVIHKKFDIKLSLNAVNKISSLFQYKGDCLIMSNVADNKDYDYTSLFQPSYGLYAHKEYLVKHKAPKKIGDLSKHTIISYNAEDAIDPINPILPEWSKAFFKIRENSFILCDYEDWAVEAALKQQGVALIANHHAVHHPELVQILPDYKIFGKEVFFAYPKVHESSEILDEIRDYLVEYTDKFR